MFFLKFEPIWFWSINHDEMKLPIQIYQPETKQAEKFLQVTTLGYQKYLSWITCKNINKKTDLEVFRVCLRSLWRLLEPAAQAGNPESTAGSPHSHLEWQLVEGPGPLLQVPLQHWRRRLLLRLAAPRRLLPDHCSTTGIKHNLSLLTFYIYTGNSFRWVIFETLHSNPRPSLTEVCYRMYDTCYRYQLIKRTCRPSPKNKVVNAVPYLTTLNRTMIQFRSSDPEWKICKKMNKRKKFIWRFYCSPLKMSA
jgi:hypothetical protein